MAKMIENNTMKMDVFKKIHLGNSTMLDQYQEKRRQEDKTVLMESRHQHQLEQM